MKGASDMKKFYGIDGAAESAELSTDFEEAKRFDKVRVGRLGVFFRDGLKLRFLAYSGLERVFIRVQEVNLKTC